MKTFKTYITEEKITQSQLDELEKVLDKLFAPVDINVEFTRHFMDRVNDARNVKDITIEELSDLFKKSYGKYKEKFEKMYDGFEAVLNDHQTKINLPFIIRYDRKQDDFDLINKTIMRKSDFKSTTPFMKV
jgi:hypothetical protein